MENVNWFYLSMSFGFLGLIENEYMNGLWIEFGKLTIMIAFFLFGIWFRGAYEEEKQSLEVKDK